MFGRLDLERCIFACKKVPGSTQNIQVSFDLKVVKTDLDRKAMVSDIDNYIKEYLQWKEFDIKLFGLNAEEKLFTHKDNYLAEFEKVDFATIILIEYTHTGNFEIEMDALSPEEAGFRQVFPQGLPLPNTKIKNRDNSVQPNEKPEFSLKELALMFQYEGQKVTRKNAHILAKQKGHNSGEKLFQHFTKYSSRQNRIGIENTPKKTQNKIILFEKIIPFLSVKVRQRATDEMNTLKDAYNNGNE